MGEALWDEIRINRKVVGGVSVALMLGLGLLVLWLAPSRAEARRIAAISAHLNAERQAIFNALHPLGTAQRIDVHEAEVIVDEAGQRLLAIRFTLYWRGPVEARGYTKVLAYYDLESQRWAPPRILATNGLTNEEATDLAAAFAGGLLQELVGGSSP